MSVQLPIEFEQVIELVDQLSIPQQQTLLQHLVNKAKTRPLNKEEKKAIYHASILSVPVNVEPSIRREDWYDTDGR